MSLLDQGDNRRGAAGAFDDGYGDLGWDDEDDFVTVRSGGHRAFRIVVAVVVLLIITFLLYRGVRGWIDAQLDPEGEPGEEVALVIPSGASTGGIATLLEEQGVVPNGTFFRYYASWKGEGDFQAGEYTMQVNSSAAEAIEVLNAGPKPQVYQTFTIPEGKWVSEALPLIAEQLPNITVEDLQYVLDSGQLQASYRPEGVTSWDGLLFPSTYEVAEDATALEVLTLMADEFQRVTAELGYGGVERRINRSAYEVIIVASMIEAEAKVDEDRAKIAQVIYNRLQEQWYMDIDAVCIFGAQDRQVQLTNDLMRNLGDYSCREKPGLPATPIAMPGRASLDAALNPEPGDWMYYVLADAEGRHFFTASAEEFEAQKEAAREAGLF